MRKVRGPLAACVAFACFACGMAACSLPRLQDYYVRPLAQTSFLYAADGSLITALHATENRVALTSAQMTQNIRDAVVAIEDRRFYTHHGVDPEAILRAAVNDLRSGHVVEGGSTITQQLVKNLYTGDDQSLGRLADQPLTDGLVIPAVDEAGHTCEHQQSESRGPDDQDRNVDLVS